MIIDGFKKLVEDNKAMLNEQTFGLFEDSIRCFDAGIVSVRNLGHNQFGG